MKRILLITALFSGGMYVNNAEGMNEMFSNGNGDASSETQLSEQLGKKSLKRSMEDVASEDSSEIGMDSKRLKQEFCDIKQEFDVIKRSVEAMQFILNGGVDGGVDDRVYKIGLVNAFYDLQIALNKKADSVQTQESLNLLQGRVDTMQIDLNAAKVDVAKKADSVQTQESLSAMQKVLNKTHDTVNTTGGIVKDIQACLINKVNKDEMESEIYKIKKEQIIGDVISLCGSIFSVKGSILSILQFVGNLLGFEKRYYRKGADKKNTTTSL